MLPSVKSLEHAAGTEAAPTDFSGGLPKYLIGYPEIDSSHAGTWRRREATHPTVHSSQPGTAAVRRRHSDDPRGDPDGCLADRLCRAGRFRLARQGDPTVGRA